MCAQRTDSHFPLVVPILSSLFASPVPIYSRKKYVLYLTEETGNESACCLYTTASPGMETGSEATRYAASPGIETCTLLLLLVWRLVHYCFSWYRDLYTTASPGMETCTLLLLLVWRLVGYCFLYCFCRSLLPLLLVWKLGMRLPSILLLLVWKLGMRPLTF